MRGTSSVKVGHKDHRFQDTPVNVTSYFVGDRAAKEAGRERESVAGGVPPQWQAPTEHSKTQSAAPPPTRVLYWEEA